MESITGHFAYPFFFQLIQRDKMAGDPISPNTVYNLTNMHNKINICVTACLSKIAWNLCVIIQLMQDRVGRQ